MANRVSNITALEYSSPELDAAIAELDVLGAAATGFSAARKQAKIQNSPTAWLDTIEEIVARETYRCAKAVTSAASPKH